MQNRACPGFSVPQLSQTRPDIPAFKIRHRDPAPKFPPQRPVTSFAHRGCCRFGQPSAASHGRSWKRRKDGDSSLRKAIGKGQSRASPIRPRAWMRTGHATDGVLLKDQARKAERMGKYGFVYVDLRERAEGIGCQAESVVGARIGSSRMDDICRDF